ncbi:hypothetical protein FUAX_31100 [Fulvitalea axinellae]|uniref:Cell division protein ZapA n=1 Tax=Fulvitalea axinellae TaxID=1182444 RepID=A0AAU9CKH4_9BACT|nr:hypothetical protein FUAX_31100 [Fulvitalea axinellae]
MGELSIKLKIADREYPMKVRPEDEEMIRNAGKELNEKLKELKRRFRLDDRQDLLAMIAFDYLVQSRRREEAIRASEDMISEKLDQWDGLLNESLS